MGDKYVVHRNAAGSPIISELNADGDPHRNLTVEEIAGLLVERGDVQDLRTPDWSSVPVGTAGTATVNGLKGVRAMRVMGVGGTYWRTARSVGLAFHHDDNRITDFVPDVVVDEALIGQIKSEIDEVFHSTGWNHAIAHVVGVLQLRTRS
jgi:hypothetical protein